MGATKDGKLNYKQQKFVKEVTDPKGEGFLNIPKAHNLAYGSKWDSSRHYGYVLANNPVIKNEISQALEKLGFGTAKRTEAVVDIVTGNASRDVELVTPKGEVVTVKETANFNERLKGIELLNRMSALYEHNKIESEMVSSEMKRLQEELRKEVISTEFEVEEA